MTGDRIPLSLLVIDDSPDDRDAYRRYLGTSPLFDFSILEAETLEEGVRLCGSKNPEGVLLDYYLPDGEGLEFLERVPSDDAHVRFFTIMLTGQGSEVVAAQAINLGATDYLPKWLMGQEMLCQVVHSAYERLVLRRAVLKEQREKEQVVAQLRDALSEVKRLSGLLPICAHCKSIRKDDGYWRRVEAYCVKNTGTMYSHGICPDCLKDHYGMEPPEERTKKADLQ